MIRREEGVVNLSAEPELLKIMFKDAPLGIALVDGTDTPLLTNRQLQRMLGYSHDEIRQMTFQQLTYPEDLSAGTVQHEALLRGDIDSYHLEKRYIRKNGEVIWGDFHAAAVRDEAGTLQYAVGMVADITRRRELMEQYRRFYYAADMSPNVIILTDKHGQITYVNQAFEGLYGYDPKEVLGKNPRILNPGKSVYLDQGWSEDQYQRLFPSLWKAVMDPAVGRWEGEVINRKKDGTTLLVRLFVHSIRDDDGRLLSMMGMPVDVSEQRRVEEKLRVEAYKAIADLAEKRDNETGQHMKRIGVMAAFVAEQLGLSARFRDDIRVFAPLHDIGKVGISDAILLAPRKLTDEEFAIIKRHPVIGHEILKGKPGMEMAAEIALCHQEKYDGSGYPAGLQGDAIPLGARITTLVDVYDALRGKRPYKREFSHSEALAVMEQGRGSHFDPGLLDIFLRESEMFRAIFNRYRDPERE